MMSLYQISHVPEVRYPKKSETKYRCYAATTTQVFYVPQKHKKKTFPHHKFVRLLCCYYAVGLSSNGITFVTNFVKIGPLIYKLKGGTQHGDLISLLFSF